MSCCCFFCFCAFSLFSAGVSYGRRANLCVLSSPGVGFGLLWLAAVLVCAARWKGAEITSLRSLFVISPYPFVRKRYGGGSVHNDLCTLFFVISRKFGPRSLTFCGRDRWSSHRERVMVYACMASSALVILAAVKPREVSRLAFTGVQ